MAGEHSNILTEALVRATARGWRLFRNEIGTAFHGKVTAEYPSSAGKVVELVCARRVTYGVCNPGGFDLLGWQTVKITPDMVGMRVAVFTAIDGKTEGYTTMSKAQRNFARELCKAGGVVVVARREKDGETVSFSSVSPEDHHGRG